VNERNLVMRMANKSAVGLGKVENELAYAEKGTDDKTDDKKPAKKEYEKSDWSHHKRKCTDIGMLLFFIVFWIGMFAIAGVGVSKGEPARLTNGVDYQGVTCGTGAMKSKENIVYPRITTDLSTQSGTSVLDMKFYGICVDKCPKSGSYVCKYDHTGGNKVDPNAIANNGPCWYVGLDYDDIFNYCTPKQAMESEENTYCVVPSTNNKEYFNFKVKKADGTYTNDMSVSGTVEYFTPDSRTNGVSYYDAGKKVPGTYFPNKNCATVAVRATSLTLKGGQDNPLTDQANEWRRTMSKWAGDIETTAGWIFLFGFVITCVFGFVLLFVFSKFLKTIVWLVLDATIVICLAMTFMLSFKGGMLVGSPLEDISDKVAAEVASTGLASAGLQHDKDMQKTYEMGAYFMMAATIILFVMVCFYRKKVNIAIGVMKEASDAIEKMPALVVWPFLPYIFQLGLFAYTVYIGMYIASAGDIDVSDFGSTVGVTLNATDFKSYSSSNLVHVLGAFHFFGFLWTDQLIQAISMCTTAGAISAYYFARDKSSDDLGKAGLPAMTRSLWNSIRYNLGSLAAGSLIIAIIKFLRYCLMYLDKETKDAQKKSVALRVVMKCAQCCLRCLEKFLKYITRNAYIIIAIKGKSFCSATKEAFGLLFSNMSTFAVAEAITHFIMLLSKVAITISVTFCFFLYVSNNSDYEIYGKTPLSNEFIPVLVVLLVTYLVASTFMEVFHLAVGTVIICFCIDKEDNKDNPNGYYMSSELLKAVGLKKEDLHK